MSTRPLARGPFPGFVQLAPTTFYYNPTSVPVGTSHATRDPDLIVLSTWMGAAPKHIQKYIVGYQSLYPHSALLILTNSISDIVLRTQKYHEKNLEAAILTIHDVAETSSKKAKILLHLFSNGGALHATHLASLYRRQFDVPFPITGFVLDSAPGRATYRRSIAAMSVGLSHFVLFRVLGLLLIHALCMGMWVKHHVLRQENFIVRVRRQLLDPDLFPTAAPRVYLYSKADAMVGWKDVEENARVAESTGYVVRKERFEGSKHVGHLVDDPVRYWDAVKSVTVVQG